MERRVESKGHKAHHYVPDFLLKNWHSPDVGKLVHYEWTPRGLDIRRYSAKHVAKQEHLYSTKSASGELNVGLERDFFSTRIDSPAATVMRQLCSTGVSSLTALDRETWTRFLLAQMTRVPSMIEHFQDSAEREFAEGAKEIASRPGQHHFLEYANRHAPNAGRNIAVEILPNVIESPKLKAALLNAKWDCIDLRWSKVELLIGDRPLLKIGPMSGNFLITMPLTPHIVFCVASFEGSLQRMKEANSTSLARTLNKDTVMKAQRYVYSKDESHTALIRKYLANPFG